MTRISAPETRDEFERYFDLRWRILREHWQQPRGSEQDDREDESLHCHVTDLRLFVIVEVQTCNTEHLALPVAGHAVGNSSPPSAFQITPIPVDAKITPIQEPTTSAPLEL